MIDGEHSPICGYSDAFATRGAGARCLVAEISIFTCELEDGPIGELLDLAWAGIFSCECERWHLRSKLDGRHLR